MESEIQNYLYVSYSVISIKLYTIKKIKLMIQNKKII